MMVLYWGNSDARFDEAYKTFHDRKEDHVHLP